MMFIGYCYFVYALCVVNVSDAFKFNDILFNPQFEEVTDFKFKLTNDSWIITKENFDSKYTPL